MARSSPGKGSTTTCSVRGTISGADGPPTCVPGSQSHAGPGQPSLRLAGSRSRAQDHPGVYGFPAVPGVVVADRIGGYWLLYGGWLSGIRLQSLEPRTGKLSAASRDVQAPAARRPPGRRFAMGCGIEGPFLDCILSGDGESHVGRYGGGNGKIVCGRRAPGAPVIGPVRWARCLRRASAAARGRPGLRAVVPCRPVVLSPVGAGLRAAGSWRPQATRAAHKAQPLSELRHASGKRRLRGPSPSSSRIRRPRGGRAAREPSGVH
jgi:hypothetical protein